MAKKNFKTGTSIEIVGLESLLSCSNKKPAAFNVVLFSSK